MADKGREEPPNVIMGWTVYSVSPIKKGA